MAKPEYGVALYGEPKYSEGFKSFDYVNPEAPKGGVLNEAAYSGFDTVNPFVINGVAAPGIGLTHDTLMKQSADEQFTLYGLIAETIDISDDRQTVAFKINPKACFSDGSSIKAEDVLFSFNILKEKGLPTYRAYYRDVLSVETPQEDLIVFHLSPTTNRELPLILGDLPVLSKRGINFFMLKNVSNCCSFCDFVVLFFNIDNYMATIGCQLIRSIYIRILQQP